jgi:RTX calcium-binding nonapeptide repeat (4 copies)
MAMVPCFVIATTRTGEWRRPLLLAGLILALVQVAAPPPSAKAAPLQAPQIFWGVSPQLERPQEEYFRMKRGGVDSVRFPIPWDAVERQRGVYDFALIDRYVTRAATAGLEVFPAINAPPPFYGGDFRTLPVQTAEQRAGWERLLRALVRRYGPGGAFWTENPQIPPQPVWQWQIWNEANFFYFTEPRSPSLYGELVKISHRVITAEDPGAKIILSGLFAHPRQSPPQAYQAADFLDQLYQVDGIKDYFDGVALHPYALDADDLPADIEEIRAVMAAHDDAKTGLYLTELGWGDGTDTGFEKGPEGQGRELAQAFQILLEYQRKARIKRMFWYSWEDISGSCNFCDSVGLMDEAGRPKPVWDRYVSFSGCFGGFSTLIGTGKAEALTGTPGDDVIVAGGGDDTVIGSGGNDRICAEDGADRIDAGAGRDSVGSGAGDDRILTRGGADLATGDLGNDRILAATGADRIFGDLGIDRLFAGGGNDVAFGDAGNDFLYGAGGNDRLYGLLGNDRLFGQGGNDRLFGAAGDDFLVGGPGADRLKPGKGRDRTRP